MDGFDLLLLIVVAYVALMSLVRLMLARRDRLIQDLQRQVEAQMRGRTSAPDSPGNKAA
jgi:hypothetical protein